MLSLIYLICFLDILGMAILLPVVPAHLTSIGASRLLISFLMSLNACLQIISGPFVGSWSDTKGRKPLLIQSLFFTLISNVLILLCPSSLFVYIISRILYGLTWHAQILLKALIASTVPQNKLNDVFAMIGAIIGLSFVVGPILGGVVSSMENGFFKITILLNIFGAICLGVSFLLPDIKPNEANKDAKDKPMLAQLTQAFVNLTNINWNVFWDVFLFKFLAESAYSGFFSTFGIVFMDHFGATQGQMALTISLFSLVLIIMNISMGKITAKFYMDDTMGYKRNFHGFLGLLCTFMFLYAYTGFWSYILVMINMGVFRTILDTTWSEMLVKRTSVSDKGRIMGSFESIVQMANLVTPLAAGYIGVTYGYSETYLITLAFLLSAVLTGGYCLTASTNTLKND